jgi:glyoxylase-like metal-dependent hydrolase (beta-lactamase superfamily II)
MKNPEITPSVRSALIGNSNVYLLSRANRHILVDTGAPGGFLKLKRRIEQWGVRFTDIALIVITHAHYDHTGSTYEMAAITSAPVAAHENAVPLLSAGEIRVPAGISPYGRFISGLGRIMAERKPDMARYHPVVPSVIVSDRLDLSPYGFDGEILYTPGHTDDSISIVLADGSCCTGDCCFNMPPFPWTSVVPPLADFPGQLEESMVRLLEAGAERLYPGHGPSFTGARLVKSIERGVLN